MVFPKFDKARPVAIVGCGVMGAKDSAYTFPEGKRTGFDPNGMVVRVYEGDSQGKVVYSGAR